MGSRRRLLTQKAALTLINNGGHGSYGAIEDVPIDEDAASSRPLRPRALTQLALHMRASQRRILNISFDGGAYYSPWAPGTRHQYSRSVQRCTATWKLKSSVSTWSAIEPGGIKTPWGLIAAG